MNYENQREPTPEEIRRRRDEKMKHDQAGQVSSQADTYGVAQGINQVMDKRIVVSALHNRAGEMRSRADGLERLAELLSAAAHHDYALFAAVLSLLDRR
jgi:hypothetical protein